MTIKEINISNQYTLAVKIESPKQSLNIGLRLQVSGFTWVFHASYFHSKKYGIVFLEVKEESPAKRTHNHQNIDKAYIHLLYTYY